MISKYLLLLLLFFVISCSTEVGNPGDETEDSRLKNPQDELDYDGSGTQDGEIINDPILVDDENYDTEPQDSTIENRIDSESVSPSNPVIVKDNKVEDKPNDKPNDNSVPSQDSDLNKNQNNSTIISEDTDINDLMHSDVIDARALCVSKITKTNEKEIGVMQIELNETSGEEIFVKHPDSPDIYKKYSGNINLITGLYPLKLVAANSATCFFQILVESEDLNKKINVSLEFPK